MNTDDLISKYLDGELSDSEDALLRSEVSENPKIKEDFDDAIFMHYSLKEDVKRLKLPDELRINTQDAVLMRIMNEQPALKKLQTRKEILAKMSYAAAAILILGFSFISEFPALKYYNQLAKYQSNELNKANRISLISMSTDFADNSTPAGGMSKQNTISANRGQKVQTIKSAIVNSANSINVAKDAFRLLAPESLSDELSILADNSNTNSVIEIAESSVRDIDNQSTANDNEIDFSNNTVQRNAFSVSEYGLPKLGSNDFGDNNSLENYYNNQMLNPDVELTTCFGTNLANNVFDGNQGTVSLGLSQSIGYRLNNTHKVGFEFGYMNYSFLETRMIKVPVENFDELAKIEVQNPNNSGPTILIPVSRQMEARTIWGTMFYEYRLIDLDAFTLEARLGIGGSKDGLLSLSRLVGAVELVKGLSLNIGLDGRMFYTTLPETGSDNAKFRSAVSVIYGIQFNL